MSVVASFVRGVISVITVTASPQLYRYPYRSSAEGLRGDMLRVGGDIDEVLHKLNGDAHGPGRDDTTEAL